MFGRGVCRHLLGLTQAVETPPQGSLESTDPAAGRHHPLLLSMLAEEIGCSPSDIADFE